MFVRLGSVKELDGGSCCGYVAFFQSLLLSGSFLSTGSLTRSFQEQGRELSSKPPMSTANVDVLTLSQNPNADIRHLAYLENSTLAWWNELSDIAEAMENWQRTDENAHLFTKYGPRVSQLLPSAQPGTLKRKRGNTNKHTANLPVVAVKSTYNEMLAYHVQRITNSGPLEDNRDRADGKHSTRAFNTSSTRYPDWPLARELDNVISDDMANDGKWQCPVVGCKYDENGRPCKTKDSLYRHFRTVSFRRCYRPTGGGGMGWKLTGV